MTPLYISQSLNLGLTQQEIDFVDINLNGDIPLFIDPYFLGLRVDSWSLYASRTVRNFFQHFLTLVRTKQENEAFSLFSHLSEPNETGLGLSRGKSQGRGVGSKDSLRIFQSLLKSRAVQTGIVEHLEDCRLFVEGIDKDKTSDMTTNIIRHHLIEYTQTQCRNHKISLTRAPSGFMWNTVSKQWDNHFTDMLLVAGRKLLLVPKAIVSYSDTYVPSRYHQHFILNFLQHEHLRMGSILVEKKRLRNGEVKHYVRKKKLKASVAPPTKEFITIFTSGHPNVFEQFKITAAKQQASLANEHFTGTETQSVVQHLIKTLKQVNAGEADAKKYEKVIAAILELLFYPHLIAPDLQVKIHGGRKIIDIVYDNAAMKGFFWRLHKTYQIPCQFVFVECKNYNSDPKNPELDQLSGRFAANRGRFGLLVCRTISQQDLFLRRCADTYGDGNGLIIPLSDDDLCKALTSIIDPSVPGLEVLLQQRFKIIALKQT